MTIKPNYYYKLVLVTVISIVHQVCNIACSQNRWRCGLVFFIFYLYFLIFETHRTAHSYWKVIKEYIIACDAKTFITKKCCWIRFMKILVIFWSYSSYKFSKYTFFKWFFLSTIFFILSNKIYLSREPK